MSIGISNRNEPKSSSCSNAVMNAPFFNGIFARYLLAMGLAIIGPDTKGVIVVENLVIVNVKNAFRIAICSPAYFRRILYFMAGTK